MILQQVPDRPWATVEAEMFYYKGRDYLFVVGYCSNYSEEAPPSHKNSEA